MSNMFSSAEQFWDNLLSRDPDLIREALRSLDAPSRLAVQKHLRSMAEEEGWMPQQRQSALLALAEIKDESL